jgi:hypothetical protein
MRHPAIEDLAILRATLRPATVYPKHDHSPASRRPAGYFALHWDTIDGGEIEIVDKGGTDLGALVSVARRTSSDTPAALRFLLGLLGYSNRVVP